MKRTFLYLPCLAAALALFYCPGTLRAQESTTLDAVVVTANRTEETLREVSSNVTVISEEAIKKSSAADLGELMRQQGFQVSGYTNGGETITIRGMNQSQGGTDMNTAVLVLLNGRRFGGPTMDYIGLVNVERIEIIRGPAAVQYGPAGMGGVINIITRRGSEDTTIYAEAGIGSYDLEKIKLGASGQTDDGLIDFSFGAAQQNQGDYKTGEGWTLKKSSTGNRVGFNADLGFNFLEHHRLGLDLNTFNITNSEGGLNGIPMYGNVYHNNPVQPPDNSPYTTTDVSNYNTAFSYEGGTDDGKLDWMARYSFGKYTRKSTETDNGTGDVTSNSNNVLDNKNLTATLGYDGRFWSLSGGLDYILYEVDNRGTWSNTRHEFSDFGAFLSGKLRFMEDRLILSAGGRYDRYQVEDRLGDFNKSDTNFSPSVGLAWLPMDWLKLRTNYSLGFRMPNVAELWPTNKSYLTSPELQPEQSKTWEIGADVSWEFMTASLTYFHSIWEDKIFSTEVQVPGGCPDWMGNPGGPCYKFINSKGATLAGWELGLSADIGQALKRDFELRPYVNLTWLPTRKNDDHTGSAVSTQKQGFDELTNVNEITVAYGVNFFEPNIDLAVNLNVNYAGEKMTRNWTDYLPDTPWVPYTPGSIVDLVVEKGLMDIQDKGKVKLRAEVNNLMDKYDESYMHYPGPGRNFYVGLVYEYK